MLEHALAYAAEGRPVFPLVPRTKRPLTQRGFHEATTDSAQIREWWGRTPTANTGQACGAFWMLDIDVKDGKRGDRELVELVRDNGPIPWTRQVTTPSGGYQYHFRAPVGVRIARTIGKLAPGIDGLGWGGYSAALPPNVTDDGAYAWVEDGAPLAELSGWLLERILQLSADAPRVPDASAWRRERPRWTSDVRSRADRAIAYVSRIAPAVAGQGGHDATFDVALALVRGFSLPLEIARLILADYSSRCSPPWSARELEHKLVSAAASRRVTDGYLLEARAS